MWKSGWNLDKEWVKRNEKWLILLVLGLAILILYAPFGKKTNETGVWQSGERWADSGIGMNPGIFKYVVLRQAARKKAIRISKQA